MYGSCVSDGQDYVKFFTVVVAKRFAMRTVVSERYVNVYIFPGDLIFVHHDHIKQQIGSSHQQRKMLLFVRGITSTVNEASTFPLLFLGNDYFLAEQELVVVSDRLVSTAFKELIVRSVVNVNGSQTDEI